MRRTPHCTIFPRNTGVLSAFCRLSPWRGAAVGSLCVYGFPRSSALELSFQNRIKEIYWIWELHLYPQLPAAASFHSSGEASGALLIYTRGQWHRVYLSALLMPEIHDERRQDGHKAAEEAGGLVIPPNRWDLGYM